MDDLSAFRNADLGDEFDDLDAEEKIAELISLMTLNRVSGDIEELATSFDVGWLEDEASDLMLKVVAGFNAYVNLRYGLLDPGTTVEIMRFVYALTHVGYIAGKTDASSSNPDSDEVQESLKQIVGSMDMSSNLMVEYDGMYVPRDDEQRIETFAETVVSWFRVNTHVDKNTASAITSLCKAIYALGRTSDANN